MTADLILLKKLTEIILANLENKDFGVQELARLSGVSRTGLNRRLRRVIDKSVNQFINEVRLRKALEIMLNEEMTASEVAYKVGFSSPAYFNTCFHKCFGFPPGKVKESVGNNPGEYLVANIIPGQKQNRLGRRISAMQSLVILSFIAFIAFAAYNYYPRIFKSQTIDDLRSSDGRISVAVMPFHNITDDKIWDGIQHNLISYLSNNDELIIRQKEHISQLLESNGITNYASITPSLAGEISRKLDANVFISGVIIKTNNITRVNAQLINSKSKQVFRAFQLDINTQNPEIFKTMDSVSALISDFLLISKLKKEVSGDNKPYSNTNSPEAFQFLLDADNVWKRGDTRGALNLYAAAVAADSNYIPAIIFLSMRYMDLGMVQEAREWCRNAYNKRDKANKGDRLMIEWYHADFYSNYNEQIKYLKQYEEFDDHVPIVYWHLGYRYVQLFQYDQAVTEFKKALDIYKKWDVKPMMAANYSFLGFAYHQLGLYRKEKSIYRKAMRDFPDHHSIIKQYAILALSEGDIGKADRYIEKYKFVLKGLSFSDGKIMLRMASVYSQANLHQEAEKCYREALLLEPENVTFMNDFSYFLIDNNIKIIEGLALIEVALKSEPDNYSFLHTQGWGLFKLGRIQEALNILQRSWELKPKYDHSIFLHIEEVRKAVGDQKTMAF